jgi:hypothetical protein
MMPSVTIRENQANKSKVEFQATSGNHFAVGRTMGEALDALLQDWEGEAKPTAILIQRFLPDAFFTKAQGDRMQDLMARRDSLTAAERTEFEALIDAELDATILRTDHLMSAKQP